MKTAIIGFGKMGQIRAKAIEQTGKKIVKIFDTNTSAETNYTWAKSPDEIISDPAINCIFVCTPNYLNKELTIKALQNNKHVFCEKPPAFNVDDVIEIRIAEKNSGKKLMYGFNHRHHGSILLMKKLIDEGRYGKVLWMRGRYGKSVDASYLGTWRANKDLAGGGILLDQGIHMLDLFLFLGGDFDEVHAMVSSLYWQLEGIEDNVFANFRNSETGVVASLHSTMTQWRHLFSLEIFLEKGYMVLNGLKTSSGTYGEEKLSIAKNRTIAPAATWDDEETFTYKIDYSWQNEIDHFFDCITKNIPVKMGNSGDALKLMKLIERVYHNKAHIKKERFNDLLQ